MVRQQLQKATGTRWQFISFPGGGERIAALLGGHLDMMVIEPSEAGEHIRAGNMRLLAQVNETRLTYVADNQFEDAYQDAAELSRFYEEFTSQMRGIRQEAGVKTVR